MHINLVGGQDNVTGWTREDTQLFAVPPGFFNNYQVQPLYADKLF